MERFSFPQLVGDTSLDRIKAVILDAVGYDTKLDFKIFWHDGNVKISRKPEFNVVALHMDKKWNCVLVSPQFLGYTHTIRDDCSLSEYL